MATESYTFKNVEINGAKGVSLCVRDGRISAIGDRIRSEGVEIDGEGGALIPGLVDHHFHLLATAASLSSVALDDVVTAYQLRVKIDEIVASRPAGEWIRGIGYHQRTAGDLTRDDLDRLAPRNPIRIQHQSGALWIVNSAGLEYLSVGPSLPECFERDGTGRLTGRVWRGDSWLRGRTQLDLSQALADVGRTLSSFGITEVTDATVSTDAASATVLGAAARSGGIPQKLTLMSGDALSEPDDKAFSVGPVKIVLDEFALPHLESVVEHMRCAHWHGRPIACHAVTAAEVAFAIAALQSAGARRGDRIEHGSIIPQETLPILAQLGIAVVTQPSFIFERGDRYLEEVAEQERGDLYRCASLMRASIDIAASSDAPYASADPWAAMKSAARRQTRSGRLISDAERVSPEAALNLFLRASSNLSELRVLDNEASADLCLLKTPLVDALSDPCHELVRLTMINGRLAYVSH